MQLSGFTWAKGLEGSSPIKKRYIYVQNAYIHCNTPLLPGGSGTQRRKGRDQSTTSLYQRYCNYGLPSILQLGGRLVSQHTPARRSCGRRRRPLFPWYRRAEMTGNMWYHCTPFAISLLLHQRMPDPEISSAQSRNTWSGMCKDTLTTPKLEYRRKPQCNYCTTDRTRQEASPRFASQTTAPVNTLPSSRHLPAAQSLQRPMAPGTVSHLWLEFPCTRLMGLWTRPAE